MCPYSTPDDEVDLSEYQIREWICEVGRRLWQTQMVEANGGNISYRLSDDVVLATPTYISKGFLEPNDLVTLDLNGRQLSGKRKTTSEIKMHLTIYKERPDMKAVVHAHPRHATAFAASHTPVPKCVLPEIEVFVGEVPITPYETPGTQEFADTLIPFLKDFTVLLLGNHGAVAAGKGVMDAYWKLEIIEAYCHTMLITQQIGGPKQVAQDKMQDIYNLKEQLGIPDRRIHNPQAALCESPTPHMHNGSPAPAPLSPTQNSSELIDQITQAVVDRLRREGR